MKNYTVNRNAEIKATDQKKQCRKEVETMARYFNENESGSTRRSSSTVRYEIEMDSDKTSPDGDGDKPPKHCPGRIFSAIIVFANGAVPIICMGLFVLFMILGTCSLLQYRKAIAGVVNYQVEESQQAFAELLHKNEQNVSEQSQDNTMITHEELQRVENKIQLLLEGLKGVSLDGDTSLELKKDSFSITANNAIIIIVFEYVVARLALFVLIKYYAVEYIFKKTE